MTELAFYGNHLLIKAAYRTPDIHSHLLPHLIVGLHEKLHCVIDGAALDLDGVWIASDVPHTAYCGDGEILLFLFDQSSDYAKAIEAEYLHGARCAPLDADTAEKIRALWARSPDDLKRLDDEILSLCGLTRRAGPEPDARIADALAYLQALDTVPEDALEQMRARACLSAGRFSHLFKQEVGIAPGRYLALEKMRKGYLHFAAGGSITDAALRAGFDSPSHFAATCKRMFGISFSEFSKS